MAKPKLTELEVTDPIEFWRSRAVKFADRLGVTGAQVNEALGIVLNAFGSDWLRETCGKRYPSVFLPRHPFTSMFNTASEADIIEVIEIAAYLKTLYRVPALDVLVTHLKSRLQYDGALMHLAFTYRFLRSGARGILLEPDVDGGRKGDIYFESEDDKFLAECFHEQFPDEEVMRRAASQLLHNLIDAANWRRLRLRLCIRVKTNPNMEVLKSIEESVRLTLETLKTASHAEIDNPIFQLSVVRMTDPQILGKLDRQWNSGTQFGPADMGMDSMAVPRSRVVGMRDGLDVNGEPGSSGFWWWPPTFKSPGPVARAKAFGNKLSDKLSQTRRVADAPCRIIVAAAYEARLEDTTSKLIMKEVQDYIVPKHKNTACIILNSRVWAKKRRYGYVATILQGNTAHGFSARLRNELDRIENETDILSELT